MRIVINGELEGMLEEVVVVCLNVLSRNSPATSEDKRKTSARISVWSPIRISVVSLLT
jgi:hypothetical protein